MVQLKNFILLVFIFYFTTKVTESTPIISDHHDSKWLENIKIQNPRFDYLGISGDKKFYVDFTKRDWDSSAKFCKDMGMDIARLEKLTEGKFLSEHPKLISQNLLVYWVDGQDSQIPTQFKFESGEVYKTELSMYLRRYSCIEYTKGIGSSEGALYNDKLCSDIYPVLCQS